MIYKNKTLKEKIREFLESFIYGIKYIISKIIEFFSNLKNRTTSSAMYKARQFLDRINRITSNSPLVKYSNYNYNLDYMPNFSIDISSFSISKILKMFRKFK